MQKSAISTSVFMMKSTIVSSRLGFIYPLHKFRCSDYSRDIDPAQDTLVKLQIFCIVKLGFAQTHRGRCPRPPPPFEKGGRKLCSARLGLISMNRQIRGLTFVSLIGIMKKPL